MASFQLMPLSGVRTETATRSTAGSVATASRDAHVERVPIGRGHAAPLCVERHEQQRIAIEPEIQRRQRRERSNEQSGADQEHHRQCHLRNDQRIAEPAARDAGAAASDLVQCLDRLCASCSHRWHEAEQQRRADRNHRRERQHTPIEREVEHDGVTHRRQLRHQQAGRPPREQQAEQCTCSRQQETLDEERTREPHARGAERPPEAHFVSACRGPRQ